jgi:hypothetical protein
MMAAHGYPITDLRARQEWVVSRSSTGLGCALPILPWTYDWDLIDSLHVEQITIDADKKRALAANCGA